MTSHDPAFYEQRITDLQLALHAAHAKLDTALEQREALRMERNDYLNRYLMLVETIARLRDPSEFVLRAAASTFEVATSLQRAVEAAEQEVSLA